MKQARHNALSAGTVMTGGILLALAAIVPLSGIRLSMIVAALIMTCGGVLLFLGLVALTSANRRGQEAGTAGTLFRLDHFLRFLRKQKTGSPNGAPGRLGRLARQIFPVSWLSDPRTGKPGSVRRALKRIGPTVHSSPMRRVIQTVCFLVFLWLFFYVCWPYTARPQPQGQISSAWQLEELNQSTGEVWLIGGNLAESVRTQGGSLHLVDESKLEASEGYAGRFRIVDMKWGRIRLRPDGSLTSAQLDRLLLGAGPWSLHELPPDYWPSHYADDLAAKEMVPADLFLVIDPLVSLSTAIASRSWVWSLVCAAIILVISIAIPRGFCGYLCPLGTLIDIFDWSLGKRITRFRVSGDGWWVHIKYYLLMGCLVCALFGVLVTGFVAAIPVVTRGLLFLGEPLQSGILRDWHLVAPMNLGHFISILLFLAVLGLGLLQPRFWCKYVCPSGAVFSLGNLLRVSERKVESTCIHCNKCVEICPFDAIKPDFTTRVTDCTLCQTCGGVCPTHAIKFVERWNKVELKVLDDPPTGETALGRRGFLSLAAGTAGAIAGASAMTAVTRALAANANGLNGHHPVRPPGSVPEREFLQMCIRCGECFKACPNNVLQAMGLEQGLDGLWTPRVNADWAGCESSCNACGQVCPTGAIRALPLEEKKVARMGLAIVNEKTCLPFAAREACQLCVDECIAAGYEAIEFTQVHTQVDDDGHPVEGTGYLAPVVVGHKCVGCGLCQTRCYGINVASKGLLKQSAIVIEAGEGKEDRMMNGSYRQLRRREAEQREANRHQRLPHSQDDYYIPEAAGKSPDRFGSDPFR